MKEHGLEARPPKKEKQEEHELTAERAVGLLFLSFRFSQGNPVLQGMIFRYMKVKYPSWELPESVANQVKQRAMPMFQKFFAAKKLRHTDDIATREGEEVGEAIEDEVEKVMRQFSKVMGDPSVVPRFKDSIKRELVKGLLPTEKDFISQGRPGRDAATFKEGQDGGERYSPREDPHFSFLCYFGFLGNSTGDELYDNMFSDMVDYLKLLAEDSSSQDGELLGDLKKVIQTWNSHHPDMKVAV